MRILPASVILFLLGCGNPTAPSGELAGTWVAPSGVPGTSFGFTIDQVGDSVHGTGTYAIEAGPGGTFGVRGSYARPAVVLEFTYDQNRGGLRQVFRGRVEIVGMKVVGLVGTVTDTAGPSFSATYTRR